ncbi:Non-specific serine/threonine protein kinase [Bertholletia excelsa]
MSYETKFLYSLIILFLCFQFCTARDTLNTSLPLKDGDLLVSGNGTFALAFFSPGNSRNRYLGIWYNKVAEQTVVWVANRDNPINDTSGVLSIHKSGNLVIHGLDHHSPVWSLNVSNASSASLLDTGNLVVFQTRGVIAWQSFDFPTDTLLPGMKLGVDRRTGLNRFLTSWRSREDPGTGHFSFKIDLNGSPQFFLYKGAVRHWRTGPWNGLRWSGVPWMTPNFIFKASYVDNQDEVSIMYSIRDPSIFSRMIVNESGSVERLTWHDSEHKWGAFWSAPKDQCDQYSNCGGYGECNRYITGEFECKCLPGFEPRSTRDWYLRDGTRGCIRKKGAQVCGDGEGFVRLARAKVPDSTTAVVNMSLGQTECREKCLRNCSCTGYTVADITSAADKGGSGSMTWHGELIDTREFSSGGQDLYIRVDAEALAQYSGSQHSHGKKKALVEITVASAAFLLLIISLLSCLIVRKIKGNTSGSPAGKDFNETGTNSDLAIFDLKVIIAATDNFSSANKLGQGGFGEVYKNEVTLIAKLQHRNLVRLIGCCIRRDEKILIYEYLPNKGLDSFISDTSRSSFLDWRKRFDIIMGIARGMLYLHQNSRLRIIHRNLKASNILLDAAMNPKILILDWLDYLEGTKFKLTQIGGRKNNSYYQDNYVNLIGHVWDLWKQGKALEVVDASLGDSYAIEEVARCIHIGLLCVQELAIHWPTMSNVAVMLCNETAVLAPYQPAFIFKNGKGPYSSSTSLVGLSFFK